MTGFSSLPWSLPRVAHKTPSLLPFRSLSDSISGSLPSLRVFLCIAGMTALLPLLYLTFSSNCLRLAILAVVETRFALALSLSLSRRDRTRLTELSANSSTTHATRKKRIHKKKYSWRAFTHTPSHFSLGYYEPLSLSVSVSCASRFSPRTVESDSLVPSAVFATVLTKQPCT